MEKIHQWVIDHDERWSFIALYVGGAILLSVFLSLFWVVLLMAVHVVIELWRHIVMRNPHPVLQALWCTKLDIALILFSLVVAVYADTVFAALGLGQAARGGAAGAKFVARFGVIERALKVFFLTIDDFARVAQIALRHLRGRKPAAPEPQPVLPDEAPAHEVAVAQGGLSKGDIFVLGFGLSCACLLAASPALTGQAMMDILGLIGRELHP